MSQIASLFRRCGLVLLIGVSLTLSSFITSLNFDQRLIDVYGQERLERMNSTQPQLVELLTFKLDNSYQVHNLREKSNSIEFKQLSSVEFIEKSHNKSSSKSAVEQYRSGNLNVLQFNFDIKKDKRSYYQIDGTDDFLVFYSSDEVTSMFNDKK